MVSREELLSSGLDPVTLSENSNKNINNNSTGTTIRGRIPTANNDYSFFDEAVIWVRAGNGGQGANTYSSTSQRRRRRQYAAATTTSTAQGPPNGGNGGCGGHVIVQLDSSLNTLAGLTSKQLQRHRRFQAENGIPGDWQFRNGRAGGNIIIRVPPGTLVQEEVEKDQKQRIITMDDESATTDTSDNHETTMNNRVVLRDLGCVTFEQPILIVAQGGQGGEGNGVLAGLGGRAAQNRGSASSSSSRGDGGGGSATGLRRQPRRIPATGGQAKWLHLTLQIVADVAVVGVPNAGKSTFLASVTAAKPKIANYPFTTVIPNLGVWVPSSTINSWTDDDDGNRNQGSGSTGLVLCDVPGLIQGAVRGVGLGHAFLRHVERCHVILHVLDGSGAGGDGYGTNDPVQDYQMVNQELVQYGYGQLAHMPQVVVVNKVDMLEESLLSTRAEDIDSAGAAAPPAQSITWTRQELEERLRAVIPHKRLMWMSARDQHGVDALMQRLAAFVRKVKESKGKDARSDVA